MNILEQLYQLDDSEWIELFDLINRKKKELDYTDDRYCVECNHCEDGVTTNFHGNPKTCETCNGSGVVWKK